MEFSEEAFDEVFETFDQDKSGTVEKLEIIPFIKQLHDWKKEKEVVKLSEFESGLKSVNDQISSTLEGLKKDLGVELDQADLMKYTYVP